MCRLGPLCLVVAVAACAAGPGRGDDPPPLAGAARQRMLAELAAFDGPDGPSALHGSPGTVTRADGSVVAYDRYCLVGTTLGADRGRAFDAFVEELVRSGAVLLPLEVRADGRPGKVLVNLDGCRIVVSTQQW